MKGYSSFAGLEKPFTEWDESAVAILPVPYDKTSTWIKGAHKGPFAVIEASRALEFYDIETDFEVYKRGIYTARALLCRRSPEKMVTQVQAKVSELLDGGKFVVTLGGEHSVSIGAVKAHSEKRGDFSVLQLDAHADLREEYEGSRYNHACVMARIKEICPAVQVGVRSMCMCEKSAVDAKNVFFAGDIQNNNNWMSEALSRIQANVYVTIDLDVFDPGVMPSTGTPEPGGLLWYQVIGFLKTVAEQRNIIGFDVVELCPNEKNKAPDFIAAKLIYKLLSYIFQPG
ncbi:MAG: agmatinase [Candidatus Omnitrophota bacterium]